MSLRLKVGGPVDAEQYLYIEREDDARLLQLLLEGEYANVLTSRQMGKTSLTFRTISALHEHGVRTVYVDLAAELKSVDDEPRPFFRALLKSWAEKLELVLDLDEFDRRHADDAPGQWLQRFFREIVAPAIDAPVVIFLDEIDSTLSRRPYTDGLFTALRGMYNERALQPAYRRITFCLLGVASPNELIKDRRTTAYNIGETLGLRDFDPELDDLSPLAEQLAGEAGTGSILLRRVLYWTGGQPFLTMKLCRAMGERKIASLDGLDAFIQKEYRSLQRLEVEDIHFQQILAFVQDRLGVPTESLELYRRIWAGERVRDRTAQAFIELKLSGLVKRDGEGFLVVRNPIYRSLFSADWIAGTEPMQALKKIKTRYHRVKVALWLVTSAALILLAVFGFREWQLRQPIHTEGADYWVEIKPGGFCMGSRLRGQKLDSRDRCAGVPVDPDASQDESPPHWVEISKPFRLAKHETTIEEFERFVRGSGRRPPPDYGLGEGLSDEQRKTLPVVGVSWQDAQDYADWVSQKTGRHYRLPTEAEWEYAARAGTKTTRYWGDDPDQACRYANVFDRRNERKIKDYIFTSIKSPGIDEKNLASLKRQIEEITPFWCDDDYPFIAPVGSFEANVTGLYDMLGNVWEWTCSAYTERYDGNEYTGTKDADTRRVIRGGSWNNLPDTLRSAYRNWNPPDDRYNYLGFRLAQDQ